MGNVGFAVLRTCLLVSFGLRSWVSPSSDGFEAMVFELDHLFILTGIGAYEAEHLVSFGLVEGTSNTHPGQGTTNRRFFSIMQCWSFCGFIIQKKRSLN